MDNERTVGEAMRPPAATVAPGTPVADVWRRLEGGTTRSLLVTDGARVVGIVRWRDVEPASPQPDSRQTAADVMVRDAPLLRPELTLDAARTLAAGAAPDLGVLPVVDATGRLVGELPSEALIAQQDRVAAAAAPTATSAAEMPERALRLNQGMTVIGRDGDHIGSVTAVVEDGDGRITHLDVAQGRIFTHTKRLPIDLVAGVSGDTVALEVSGDAVGRLPDVDNG